LDDQQPSIDAVHEAGRAVIKTEGGAEARRTREKLDSLHHKLELVRTKIRDRQLLLDDWLKDVRHAMMCLCALRDCSASTSVLLSYCCVTGQMQCSTLQADSINQNKRSK